MRTEGVLFRIRGQVQGVGFRPWVWRLATEAGLSGTVLNDGEGVLIRVWGNADNLATFSAALLHDGPPLSRVDAIERSPLAGEPPLGFRIAESEAGAVTTNIVPDAATCPACLAEVLDPANRRFRYPFTNCTHCGPRLSIVRAIPYDRARTSMSAFPMCPACQAEYEDPANRRFHAEPNACPACGPRLWLADASGNEQAVPDGRDAIDAAADRIREGLIVAIKGLGGFHLACDATNAAAVARLRERKRRYHKPFALMAPDLATIARYAHVSDAEAALLKTPAAPIVVLERRALAPSLAEEIAPGQASLGFMLPYTPLHHLLARALGAPFVLTSGNASDEPQVTANVDALERLVGIADLWLMHDRDIVNRLDDSVVRVVSGAPSTIRRARGLAPDPVPLPSGFADAPAVLALGAELKSTFCLLGHGKAIASQHIGDLEDSTTHADFRKALALYQQIYAFSPHVVAVDAHPDYLSTQWGTTLALQAGIPLRRILHHHAHVAAVLAEHAIPRDALPVLAITLDGLGMGQNGELWGGEFARADYVGFTRLARFPPVPLIGGDRATREPWRNAFAHLHASMGWDTVAHAYPDLDIVRLINARQPKVLTRMVEAGLNAPLASSAGRLFDAAAAIIGIHPERVSYEGQAAMELEALAGLVGEETGESYQGEVIPGDVDTISWRPLWQALLADLVSGVDRKRLAARFQAGVAMTVAQLAICVAERQGLTQVVLAGGVFQNRLLLEAVSSALRSHGLHVMTPKRFPANDGAIALGQAMIAAAIALAD